MGRKDRADLSSAAPSMFTAPLRQVIALTARAPVFFGEAATSGFSPYGHGNLPDILQWTYQTSAGNGCGSGYQSATTHPLFNGMGVA